MSVPQPISCTNDSSHLKANMAVCQQWPFNLNDRGFLVSTNQLDGCSTDTPQRFICQSLFNSLLMRVKNFGQGVESTVHNTQILQLTELIKKNSCGFLGNIMSNTDDSHPVL